MTLAVSSPVTGGAQTGFTTPGYPLATDVAPTTLGKQYTVSSLTGTQTGVRAHSISDPFSITLSRAANLKALQSANAITGRYGAIPKNVHKILLRKGVNYAANQAPEIMIGRLELEIPAGSDSYDPANIRAGISLLVGVLNQISAELGNTMVTGVP